MTFKYPDHSYLVDQWIRKVTPGLSSEQLLGLFEHALERLWKQAHLSMSAVMLKAVLDRVLFGCSERHPLLNTLSVTEAGVHFEEILKSARTLEPDEVTNSFRPVLTEYIAILGNLTNQVMAPGLHSELSQIKFEPKLKAVPPANGDEK